MPYTLQTRNPVLREIEADNFRRLSMYRSWAHEDLRAGRPNRTWHMLARATVASIRRVRLDQAEIA